ncbi:MAG: HAMP domain-containing protein, partial [Calditrichaeota bacterium]|nr:HAMP domain-containing protein [Calditrichota bacterium]
MRLNIGQKMALSFGLIIVLLIIISYAGISNMKGIVNEYHERVLKEKNVEVKTGEIQAEILQIQVKENDFLYSKDLQNKTEIERLLNQAQRSISEAEALTDDKLILPILKDINNELRNVNDDFNKLVKDETERGLNENSGELRRIRDSSEGIEQLLRANTVANELTAFLEVMNAEKDYLLTKDSEHISRFTKAANSFERTVQNSKFNSSVKNSLTSGLDSYTSSFRKIVELDKDIEANNAEMAKNSNSVISQVNNVINNQETLVQSLEKEIENTAASTITMLWIISILAIIMAIVAAVILTRMITVPLSKVVTVANAISDGDLSLKIDVYQHDEIGQMADSFRNMTDSITALIDEGANLTNNTLEGRLDQRADESRFRGSYRQIIEGMNEMINVFHDIISQVTIAIEQVASGAQQVSDASTAVSQGATEQASSLEETSSSMSEMSSQSKQNAENAGKANQSAEQARDAAEAGNQRMSKMLLAMNSINDSS